jgi:hypothetical protein
MTSNNKSAHASLAAVYAHEDCMRARGKHYPDNVRISRIGSTAPLNS